MKRKFKLPVVRYGREEDTKSLKEIGYKPVGRWSTKDDHGIIFKLKDGFDVNKKSKKSGS